MFRSYILPFIIWIIYQPLRWSWRFELIESPSLKLALQNREVVTFAHWHGDELGILYLLKRYNCCVMTSTSKDGELINGFLRIMGVKTSRGSSTRGGVSALKGLLRLTKSGFNPCVAVDGPKGPYHKVKPGVLEISKLTGSKICPLGAYCNNAFVFKRSWNKAYLPLPFAKISVVMGDLVPVVGRQEDAHATSLAERLEEALANAGRLALDAIAAKN